MKADLYFKEGSSDKVYHVTLESKGKGHVVNFSYGRRGSTLITGTKTNTPVTMEEAAKVFQKLVNSKLSKGYKPMDSVGGDTIPQADLPDTPTQMMCVLLNPIEEEEAIRLLDDDKWAIQPKFDGVRFMLRKKGNKVTAINRKGKPASVPNSVAKSALENEADFFVDGELIGDVLYAFDILEIDGNCVREMTLKERSDILHENLTQTDSIQLTPLTTGKKKSTLYKGVQKSNGEGVVFKKLSARYNVGRPASGGNYLKYKFYATASCIVSQVNQKRSVALELDCGTPIGNVTIPPNYSLPNRGDVVEIRYLYAYKGGSLYQPTYLGVREDIDRDECTISQLKFKE